MCDHHSAVFSFKGIVVAQTILSVLSQGLPPPSVVHRGGYNYRQGLFPYCVYIDANQELDCDCQDQHNEQMITFPPEDFLLGSNEAESLAKSIRLHSCHGLNLFLDIRHLPKQITRIRFEHIADEAKIGGLYLRPDQSIDIQLKNVTRNLEIAGNFSCPDCSTEIITEPSIVLQVVDSGNVTLESLVVAGSNVDFRLIMRSAAGLAMWDSFFSELPPSSIEIFNVPELLIIHSEFHNLSRSAIIIHPGVKNVTVKDSLMDKNVLDILSPALTALTLNCTAPPYHSDDDLDITCSHTLGRYTKDSSVESAGAIIIAIVSAVLLLAAVGVLFLLHRQGKLEQYL